MKNFLLIALALLSASSVYAVTATPSSVPETTGSQEKLENLKDRLASAASQLQQSQKRAIFGTVKTTSVSTITVETATKDIKIELTDEIIVVQVLKGKRTELTTDDIAKGDVATVFGDYDSTLDLLKAKVIFIQGAIPERISGVVSEMDKKNFTITVATAEGKSMIVDIETATKNILWDKAGGSSKGAFSKYAIGDTVFVLATPDPKIEDRFSAIRALDIGNMTGAPTAAPTPTVAASPSATLKVTPKTTVKPTPTP